MGGPYYSSTDWLLMGLLTMVSVATIYVAYYRASKRILAGIGSRQAAAPTISQYYYVSIRSQGAENKAKAAAEALEGGYYAKAVANARGAAEDIASLVCEKVCGRTYGSLSEAAEEAAKRGYRQWPDDLRSLDGISKKRSPDKGDAAKAIEITLRLLRRAREMRVEPSKEAGAGKEGGQVPRGS